VRKSGLARTAGLRHDAAMIERYLRRHDARFLRELQDLIRFPSVSAQPDHAGDVRACADWLAAHFRQIGLQVRIHKTAGQPILEAWTRPVSQVPTVLIYGHYDVQPPDPLALWKTPPFAPVIRGGKIFGRGASDNKGQFFAHVKAIETLLATGAGLPVQVRFLLEGEEEVGSGALLKFCRRHARRLRADYCLVSDSGMFAKGLPTLTYATRGIAAFEVRVDGPGRDLHSGVFGGSVANPAQVLARMLAQCVDEQGRVTIPGFYDDVRPLAAWERRAWRRLPFHERDYARRLGVPALSGETGYTTLERRWARPTFEINGLTSGYQGAGGKTIVPAWASAKITVRLVPDQAPAAIDRLVVQHLRRLCPKTVRLTVEAGHYSPPFLTDPDGPGARAARAALRQAFGREPVCVREGGTIHILELFRRQLGAEVLLVGLGLADDNWHSPNEKMELQNFRRGIVASIELLRRLGR
jgi:acetylornithine deacetylase/succinyl-diaminopimelate desuccinylase-like protein